MDKPKKAPKIPKPAQTSKLGVENASPDNAILFSVIAAVVVILLTLLYLYTRKTKKGRGIVVVGPCDSGKTTILGHLVSGKMVDTVTSITANECTYSPGNGKADLVLKDLPGHDRVRIKFWDSHKANMRGIVCIIDAAGGNKAIREGAEVLYSILTDPLVNSISPNILVFANKQDLPTAKTVKVIRTQLEREITTLRMTKSAGLQTTGGSNVSSKTLGKLDRDFEFDHLTPIKVEFGEGNGGSEDTEITSIVSWLAKVA